MSVNTVADDSVAPIDTNEAAVDARFSFKLTHENKSDRMTVTISHEAKETIQERVVRNGRWRSDSQFLVDALVFYLDNDGTSDNTAEEVIEGVDWIGEANMAASITPTLFKEIEMMVNHTHTPWNTKQEFYICAIRAYHSAGYPVVTQR